MRRQERCKEEVLQGLTACLRQVRPPTLRTRLRALQRGIEREDNYYITVDSRSKLTGLFSELTSIAGREMNATAEYYMNQLQELTRSQPRPKERSWIMSVVEKGKKLFSGVFAKKNPYQSEADNAQEGMRSLETLISANTAKLKGIASQIDALFCGAATMDRMSQEFKNVRMRGDALLLERKSMEAQLEQYRNAWSEKARISGLLSQAEISKQMDVFTVDVAKMGALISNAADEKAERDAKARELSGILAMGESGLLSTDSLTAQPVSEFDKLFDEQLVAATPKVTPTQPEPSLFEAMMNPSIQNDNPQKDAETPSAIPLDI